MDGHRGLLFNLLAEFVLRGVMLNGGHYFSPASALGQPFMVWSKNKVKLNALIDLDRGPSTIAWSTNAARLDVPPHIAERVLSHVAPEGKVAGGALRSKTSAVATAARDPIEDCHAFIRFVPA